MKRDDIRIVQAVLAANRPEPTQLKEYKLWEQIRDDFAKSIRMRNPFFNLTLFTMACHDTPRKPTTINHEDIQYAKKKAKR